MTASPSCGAGEQVAGAVQHVGKQFAGDLLDGAALLGAGDVVADDGLALVHDPLDYDGLCPHLEQFICVSLHELHGYVHDGLCPHLEQFICVSLHELHGYVLALIRDAREDGRLGEVGGEDVGAVYELGHGSAQLIGIGGVLDARIAQDRIDDAQGARILAIEALDDGDLLGGSEEAGVHAVELDALLAPGVEVGRRAPGYSR